MSFKNWTAGLAVVFSITCASKAEPPLEAYGRLPTLSDVTLSPNGNEIAFVRSDASRRIVVVEAVSTKKPISVVDFTDQKLRSLQWADNTNLVITTSQATQPPLMSGGRSEWYLAQYLDTTTNVLHRLLSSEDPNSSAVTMNVIEGTLQPRTIHGHTVVFFQGISFPNRIGRRALFREDLTTGVSHIVSPDDDAHGHDWLVGPTGSVVAEARYFESNQHWILNVYRDGDPTKPVDVSAPIEGPDIQGLNEDGSGVVIRLPWTENFPHYQTISISNGSSAPWHPLDVPFNSLFQNERTGRVVGAWRFSDKSDYAFFDPHLDLAWRSARDAFSDATDVKLFSYSDDYSKLVVLAFGPRYGAAYFLVDLKTGNADRLGPQYDGIDDVFQRTWIDYPASDGRVIHAYLTTPAGHPPKNLPLIVVPHSGPSSRDQPGFDWLSQAFASRGYAVLQPQFRGSYGFGRDLTSAGFGEFGRKMQSDLSDGVRDLAAHGLVDAKRVCVVGDSSYGGYAALAGATFDTGIYRCAVSVGGISDLHKLLASWHWPRNTYDDRGERYWDRFLGATKPDDVKLDAISPIKHVDKVSIPILLMHGTDDTVVPISQSEDMADALKAAGKKSEFVRLQHEDQWLSRSATRTQMLQAAVKFVEANNPP